MDIEEERYQLMADFSAELTDFCHKKFKEWNDSPAFGEKNRLNNIYTSIFMVVLGEYVKHAYSKQFDEYETIQFAKTVIEELYRDLQERNKE